MRPTEGPKRTAAIQVRSTSPEWVAGQLKEAGGEKAPATVQSFIVGLAMALIDNRSFDDDEWVNTLTVPYLAAHMPEADAKKAGQAFAEACRKEVRRLSVCLVILICSIRHSSTPPDAARYACDVVQSRQDL